MVNVNDATFSVWVDQTTMAADKDLPLALQRIANQYTAKGLGRSGRRLSGQADHIYQTAKILVAECKERAASPAQCLEAFVAVRKSVLRWNALLSGEVEKFAPSERLGPRNAIAKKNTALLADFDSWSFLALLERGDLPTLKEYLLGLIADGETTPRDAQSLLDKYRLGKLLEEPNVGDYSPEAESFWTLAMTVAWISWRDLGMVTRNWEKYTSGRHYWRQSLAPNQAKIGAIPETSHRPSVLDLSLGEAAEQLYQDSRPQILSIRASIAELENSLLAGKVVAFGKQHFGGHEELPPERWISLQIANDGHNDYLMQKSTLDRAFDDVRLKSVEVMKLWPAVTGTQERQSLDLKSSSSDEGVRTSGAYISESQLAPAAPSKKLRFANGTDEIIYVGVTEYLAQFPGTALETCIRETAQNLSLWPSDAALQYKLVDRMKKRVHRQRRR